MKTIKVAFYKKPKPFYTFSSLIRFKQSFKFENRYARYSHSELIFEDWFSFSSSETDGGVRFKKIKYKKGNWDTISLKISDSNYNKILSFCEKEVWNKYNFIWIVLAQILNMKFKWNWDWFCSEICARALQEMNEIWPFTTLFINPARLAELLEENWFYIDK